MTQLTKTLHYTLKIIFFSYCQEYFSTAVYSECRKLVDLDLLILEFDRYCAERIFLKTTTHDKNVLITRQLVQTLEN